MKQYFAVYSLILILTKNEPYCTLIALNAHMSRNFYFAAVHIYANVRLKLFHSFSSFHWVVFLHELNSCSTG
jgi:hypothetical protein